MQNNNNIKQQNWTKKEGEDLLIQLINKAKINKLVITD